MSEPVQRFTQWCTVTHGHVVSPHSEGPYVYYAAYERLQAENEVLREQNFAMNITCVDIERYRAALQNMVDMMDFHYRDECIPLNETTVPLMEAREVLRRK